MRAFDDVLLLQQNYCSMGQEQSPDDATIRKSIAETVVRADTPADGTPPR
ncbi:hypothetical protein [Lentzea indica]|nr:hypothetical protein [Lentzea indica]